MWIAELKLNHKDCPIVTRCQKFNVVVLSYPSVWYEKRGNKYATTTCYFQNVEDKIKKAFLKDLKLDKRITNLDIAGDVFTYEINLKKHGEHVMLYHQKQIFFVKPTVNHFDGHEYWEVASWDRKVIEQFIKELEKHMDICIILKLEQAHLKEVRFPQLMPQLSENQKKILEIAYKHGFYNYPKKKSIKDLAKIAKLSVSTFQEHLRKAEIKILPLIIEEQVKK